MRIPRKGDDSQLDFDDPRLIEVTQKHEALQGQAAALANENASLVNRLAQHDALQEDLQYNYEPIPVQPWSSKPDLFLHVVGWLVVARMLLFGLVEKFGAEAPYFGIGGDILFALLTVWVLFYWMKAEWHVETWLLIPKIILVLLSLTIAANTFTQGAIWDGSFLPVEQSTVEQPTDQPTQAADAQAPAEPGPGLSGTLLASGLALFFLALAASRYCAWSIFRSQKFLDHPLRSLRGAKEFYDKRRVH
jgi:hypothetical protein